jgi:hypothetical protein
MAPPLEISQKKFNFLTSALTLLAVEVTLILLGCGFFTNGKEDQRLQM